MAEWKYDQWDGDDENGEDEESTSSVSLYVSYHNLICYCFALMSEPVAHTVYRLCETVKYTLCTVTIAVCFTFLQIL